MMENEERLPMTELEDVYSSRKHNDVEIPIKRVSFNTLSSTDYLSNEAYKTLRTNIFFCGSEVKTIVVTSCRAGEGKSTVSTELTKSLAENGKKTLLIDADMRKSVMLKNNLRSSDVEGLSEVLSGMADASQVIFHTQHPNFDVMFAGHFPPNPVELIGNGKFEQLLHAFKERYDYVIVDSPPLGLVIDAAVIASFCDGAILVINQGKTNRRDISELKNQLDKSGCRILGAVLNETEKSRTPGKYYKSYKYY